MNNVFQLGARLRHARMAQKMTLKQVAQKVDCSESFLSKIENNVATPSLSTLHNLAKTLDTSVAELMAEKWELSSPVLYAGQRQQKNFKKKGNGAITLENLTPNHKGALLQADIYIIEPGVSSDGAIEHFGEEVGYVLEGQLELHLGNMQYILSSGDSFYFPSDIPHSYKNNGTEITKILWINTPITF